MQGLGAQAWSLACGSPTTPPNCFASCGFRLHFGLLRAGSAARGRRDKEQKVMQRDSCVWRLPAHRADTASPPCVFGPLPLCRVDRVLLHSAWLEPRGEG